MSILLVPFQPVKDGAIADIVASHLSGPYQIYSLSQPQQLKGLFREVAMTIGMRFHALIMSAAEGARSFAISYDPKVDALAQALNLPGYDLEPTPMVLPTLPDDPALITQAWLDCYHSGNALSENQSMQMVTGALRHQALLSEILFRA